MVEYERAPSTYRLLTGARIRAQMQYKASFIMSLIGTFVGTAVDLTVIIVLFGHVDAMAGWSLPEVCMLYGMSSVAFGISELVFGGFDGFAETVRTGQFDSVLLKPVSSFTFVLSSEFVLRRFGRIMQGLGALAYGIIHSGQAIAGGDWILIVLALAGGVMAYGALLVVQATACFWSVDGLEAFNILTYGGNELLSHPLDIYAGYMRRFFMFVVPMAFVNYVPIGSVLGKPLVDGVPGWAGWVSPIVGPVMMLLAMRFWRFGVSHYQGTGS